MLLVIDTSGFTGVAAVDDDGGTVCSWGNQDPRGHAEDIGPLLERVLDEAGRDGIDAVAYGTGPGPYTGLRVGIAAARAFALARDVPLLPVLSHDAIALTGHRQGTPFPFAVVTDAKRRERYWTVYRRLDAAGLPERDGEPQVGPEPPALPLVEHPLHVPHLGRIAVLRRAVGLPAEPPDARYLRGADVTLAPRKRVGT